MTQSAPLTIVVIGASGDLARTKVIPALFSLYCNGLLPPTFCVLGFARSRFTHAEFRKRVMEHLTCRYTPGESCALRMDEFLSRCFYAAGEYDSRESLLDLYQLMQEIEMPGTNRLYYLAIPPSVFLDVSEALAGAGLVRCGEGEPWDRVVIEKPFGRDRLSSDVLTRNLANVFSEEQTYRIDHYLGKEVVQNLMVLRFANRVFEPLWNRDHIRDVRISWKEDRGVGGRGAYFDAYGIIRDVMQNHLLQILSLIAMEPPQSLSAHAVRDAKVQALRAVKPVSLDRLVLGQYTRGTNQGLELPGYTDDPAVPRGSITPTFAAAAMEVRNARWEGVPILVTAGKALDTSLAEIRIRFRDAPSNLFSGSTSPAVGNELVIRVQPDEAIDLKITSKVPGHDMQLASRSLDLRYRSAFAEVIPEAYESLILDVIRGEKGLFIRHDELAAAWDIFTPVLRDLERLGEPPESYAAGSQGPDGALRLAERFGLVCD